VSFEQLIDTLREQGHRITTPRRWTLKVLVEEGGHLHLGRYTGDY
jgi:Fe2+ or Zn2+ uptake regulation protein